MSAPFWKPVRCHGYLKQVHDGRCIEILVDGSGRDIGARYVGTGDDVPENCDCEGALDFLKIYYEIKMQMFNGIAVGEKDVIAAAYLYADTNYGWDGSEMIGCGKQPKDIIRCAVVYFRPNQKRYVPLDLIECVGSAEDDACPECGAGIRGG